MSEIWPLSVTWRTTVAAGAKAGAIFARNVTRSCPRVTEAAIDAETAPRGPATSASRCCRKRGGRRARLSRRTETSRHALGQRPRARRAGAGARPAAVEASLSDMAATRKRKPTPRKPPPKRASRSLLASQAVAAERHPGAPSHRHPGAGADRGGGVPGRRRLPALVGRRARRGAGAGQPVRVRGAGLCGPGGPDRRGSADPAARAPAPGPPVADRSAVPGGLADPGPGRRRPRARTGPRLERALLDCLQLRAAGRDSRPGRAVGQLASAVGHRRRDPGRVPAAGRADPGQRRHPGRRAARHRLRRGGHRPGAAALHRGLGGHGDSPARHRGGPLAGDRSARTTANCCCRPSPTPAS